MKSRSVITFITFLVLVFNAGCAQLSAQTSISLDRQLINSLMKGDLAKARSLLQAGADAEAVLGKNTWDNAVCTAVDNRSSRSLELLVEYGASPNAFWTDAHLFQRTPLACSILMRNFEAFDYLLANGADPSVDLYPEAGANLQSEETAFTNAVGFKAYRMALELLDYYDPHPVEIKYVARALSTSPADATHPWNYAREALIEWTLERVPDFVPRPATPAPEGFVPECIRSLRDIADGRRKGTLCPRPEDM